MGFSVLFTKRYSFQRLRISTEVLGRFNFIRTCPPVRLVPVMPHVRPAPVRFRKSKAAAPCKKTGYFITDKCYLKKSWVVGTLLLDHFDFVILYCRAFWKFLTKSNSCFRRSSIHRDTCLIRKLKFCVFGSSKQGNFTRLIRLSNQEFLTCTQKVYPKQHFFSILSYVPQNQSYFDKQLLAFLNVWFLHVKSLNNQK